MLPLLEILALPPKYPMASLYLPVEYPRPEYDGAGSTLIQRTLIVFEDEDEVGRDEEDGDAGVLLDLNLLLVSTLPISQDSSASYSHSRPTPLHEKIIIM